MVTITPQMYQAIAADYSTCYLHGYQLREIELAARDNTQIFAEYLDGYQQMRFTLCIDSPAEGLLEYELETDYKPQELEEYLASDWEYQNRKAADDDTFNRDN